MKQITLLKDHRHGDKHYLAGEQIEVDNATYDFLMGVYLAERRAAVKKEEEAKKRLDKATGAKNDK